MTTTIYQYSDLMALGGAGCIYALTETASGEAQSFGSNDSMELQITGTDAVLAVQYGQYWSISVDGAPFGPTTLDGSNNIVLLAGATDAPHAVKIQSIGAGYATTLRFNTSNTLTVTGSAPAIALLPGYGPWHTIGSLDYPAPGTYVTDHSFDANDTFVKNHTTTTFAFNIANNGLPSISFWAKASSVWITATPSEAPRCAVDGIPLPTIPHQSFSTTYTDGTAWVKVADLNEPSDSGDGPGITTVCEHLFTITLGFGSAETFRPAIRRFMIGGAGAAFITDKTLPGYAFFLGDSITVGTGFNNSTNFDSTSGSFAYTASNLLGLVPVTNAISGTKVYGGANDLSERFSTQIAPVGAALNTLPTLGVIYIGTNDTEVVDSGTAATFTSEYEGVISQWFTAYPGVPLFCFGLKLQPDGTVGTVYAQITPAIAAAVTAYNAANPSTASLLHYVDTLTTTTGIDGTLHPSYVGAQVMGRAVASGIQAITNESGSGTSSGPGTHAYFS